MVYRRHSCNYTCTLILIRALKLSQQSPSKLGTLVIGGMILGLQGEGLKPPIITMPYYTFNNIVNKHGSALLTDFLLFQSWVQ